MFSSLVSFALLLRIAFAKKEDKSMLYYADEDAHPGGTVDMSQSYPWMCFVNHDFDVYCKYLLDDSMQNLQLPVGLQVSVAGYKDDMAVAVLTSDPDKDKGGEYGDEDYDTLVNRNYTGTMVIMAEDG